MDAWRTFLEHFNGKTLCLPNHWVSSNSVNLHTDASGFGYAAVYGSHWLQGRFPDEWKNTNIAIKELLPIVLAVSLRGNLMANSRMLFFSDNQSVVHIINSQSSKDAMVMQLIRELVVATMSFNIEFRAKHIPGKYNVIPDLLSRFQDNRALGIAHWLEREPDAVKQEWLPW